MAIVISYSIVVSDFDFQFRSWVYFRTKTHWKGEFPYNRNYELNKTYTGH